LPTHGHFETGTGHLTWVDKNGHMGLQYAYFTAEDDEAAAAAFALGAWPPPTFPGEGMGLTEDVRLDELAYLESLLTGRSPEEITADPRCYAKIVSEFDEDAGVDLCGIMAVTDTFTRALAAADLSALPEMYLGPMLPEYHDYYRGVLRELAAVAQHAVTRGHHLYCFWVV
jgi:hypothetical protein